MPDRDTQISFYSNNSDIEKIFLDQELHLEVKFVKSNKEHTPYRIFLIDVKKDLTHISQNLIDTYNLCRENNSKLAVVVLHGQAIDIEKNHYFQKMLDDLGKDKPLHRLIFTKDIYQQIVSTPATTLDVYFHDAVTTHKISISQKGENLIFPLSINDFIRGMIKTLFLSGTSGKIFWLLGDPISDLELAYLLKKNISGTTDSELEINATEKNDPQSNSLHSVGNITRGEINWQTESDIVDTLHTIVTLYNDNPVVEKNEHHKVNHLHQLINWLYRPKPQKESQLPTFGKIFRKLLILAIVIIIILGGVAVVATGTSLHLLESSIKQALNGQIQTSVTSLNNAKKLKEIGEYSFSFLLPVSNIVAPKETAKVSNLYSFIDYGATSLGNIHQTYVMAENLLLSLNSSENKINYNDISLALHSNLSQVYENLTQISLLTGNNKLPGFLDSKIKNNEQFKNLSLLEEQVIQFIKVSDIIPAVLSGDQTKNIIVLLQNSQITKPSGGEIDFYLHLTLDRGKLISQKYYTTSELESLTQASVSASTKNKKIVTSMPSLREIAQNPDFSISANNLVQYLEKAINIKTDFIVATNDSLIEQLLIEEKSTTIDQFKSDLVKDTGASAYRNLVDLYLERLLNHDLSLPILGRTIAKQIGETQILLWSADSNAERIIAPQTYSGVIIPHLCNVSLANTNSCIAETSYLSESTQSLSRTNPWQGRQIKHDVSITNSSIQHEYQITYHAIEPQATASAISTTYHLYQISPSTLDQILLNDLPFSMKEVKKTTENSFDHYQISLIIGSSQNASLVFKTTTATGKLFPLPFSYSITEYRQPGTHDSGINLKINYPENLRPTIVTSQFTSAPQSLQLILLPHTSTFGFTLDQNTQ